MRYDNLSDDELLRQVYMENHADPLVNILSERLEMRLRDIEDLQAEVNRLEDELYNI